MLSGKETTGNVVLRPARQVQQRAEAALGGQKGIVVVLDVQTGGIVALYSNPTYDPQPLAEPRHEGGVRLLHVVEPRHRQAQPRPRYREIYAPGSTFKVVTSAVGFDTGTTTPTTVYPALSELDLPLTNSTLKNFGGGTCGGNTVFESFVQSCNVTFGAIGLQLGDKFPPGMENFGVGGGAPPLDVSPAPSRNSGPRRGSFGQRPSSPSPASARARGHDPAHHGDDRGLRRQRRRDARAARARRRSSTSDGPSCARSGPASGSRR